MAIDRYTDEQIERLVPELLPKVAQQIAALIERADEGNQQAARELLCAVEMYAERHPDVVVRYLARRVMALQNARLQ